MSSTFSSSSYNSEDYKDLQAEYELGLTNKNMLNSEILKYKQLEEINGFYSSDTNTIKQQEYAQYSDAKNNAQTQSNVVLKCDKTQYQKQKSISSINEASSGSISAVQSCNSSEKGSSNPSKQKISNSQNIYNDVNLVTIQDLLGGQGQNYGGSSLSEYTMTFSEAETDSTHHSSNSRSQAEQQNSTSVSSPKIFRVDHLSSGGSVSHSVINSPVSPASTGTQESGISDVTDSSNSELASGFNALQDITNLQNVQNEYLLNVQKLKKEQTDLLIASGSGSVTCSSVKSGSTTPVSSNYSRQTPHQNTKKLSDQFNSNSADRSQREESSSASSNYDGYARWSLQQSPQAQMQQIENSSKDTGYVDTQCQINQRYSVDSMDATVQVGRLTCAQTQVAYNETYAVLHDGTETTMEDYGIYPETTLKSQNQKENVIKSIDGSNVMSNCLQQIQNLSFAQLVLERTANKFSLCLQDALNNACDNQTVYKSNIQSKQWQIDRRFINQGQGNSAKKQHQNSVRNNYNSQHAPQTEQYDLQIQKQQNLKYFIDFDPLQGMHTSLVGQQSQISAQNSAQSIATEIETDADSVKTCSDEYSNDFDSDNHSSQQINNRHSMTASIQDQQRQYHMNQNTVHQACNSESGEQCSPLLPSNRVQMTCHSQKARTIDEPKISSNHNHSVTQEHEQKSQNFPEKKTRKQKIQKLHSKQQVEFTQGSLDSPDLQQECLKTWLECMQIWKQNQAKNTQDEAYYQKANNNQVNVRQNEDGSTKQHSCESSSTKDQHNDSTRPQTLAVGQLKYQTEPVTPNQRCYFKSYSCNDLCQIANSGTPRAKQQPALQSSEICQGDKYCRIFDAGQQVNQNEFVQKIINDQPIKDKIQNCDLQIQSQQTLNQQRSGMNTDSVVLLPNMNATILNANKKYSTKQYPIDVEPSYRYPFCVDCKAAQETRLTQNAQGIFHNFRHEELHQQLQRSKLKHFGHIQSYQWSMNAKVGEIIAVERDKGQFERAKRSISKLKSKIRSVQLIKD